MKKIPKLHCALCNNKDCRSGKDCFDVVNQHIDLYKVDRINRIHRSASAIEARHYCRENRLREVMLFARELNCKKIGLAFCIGLASEAKIIEEILSQEFNVISVCCKVSGINKKVFNLEQISLKNSGEVMCNPAGQAELLNDAETELNIICGLCVGHDALFSMVSKAPVTTLIVKDRVLAHNPVGAIYSQYISRAMRTDIESKQK